MKNLTLLYKFDNDIDACHLKNSIERVSNISVSIVKNIDDFQKTYYNIFVDKSNYYKTNLLLQREIQTIESFKTNSYSDKSEEKSDLLDHIIFFIDQNIRLLFKNKSIIY